MRHVVFRIDKDRYALPLASTREVVVAPPTFSAVPRAPTCIRGIMNLRGRIVPVVDLRELLTDTLGELSGTRSDEHRPSRIILLDRSRRELGLLVTEVEGIESIEKIVPAPKAAPSLKGVARMGAIAVTVLDPDGLDNAVAQAFTRE